MCGNALEHRTLPYRWLLCTAGCISFRSSELILSVAGYLIAKAIMSQYEVGIYLTVSGINQHFFKVST